MLRDAIPDSAAHHNPPLDRSSSADQAADESAEISARLQTLQGRPEWELLRRQIYAKAIKLVKGAGVTFDFRELLYDARNLQQASVLMWSLIRDYEPSVLVGPGFGAAPLLFGIAMVAQQEGVPLQVLLVRDQRKQHNKKKWVEGHRPLPGSRAVVIDDFMSSGSALPLVERALEADGHTLDLCALALFFDMWEPLGSRQISVGRLPVLPLFKRHDIGLSRDCFDARAPTMKGAYPDFVTTPTWWRYDLNTNPDYPYKSVPVIADGAVFVADDASRVWRHRLDDGQIEWCYESLDRPYKGIVQQLQYAESSLVFGCYDGTLTRLDARNGAIQWRWRQDSSIHATPELDLARQRLFINTEQWNDGAPYGHIQALDWPTGRQRWSHALAYWPPATTVYDAATNVVIAPCNDQSITCLDADHGKLLWQARSDGLVRGKPAIWQNRLYLITENGMLQCFDLAEGNLVWAKRYGLPQAHQFVTIRGDCVFVLDGKWNLLAFDAHTGALRWLNRLRSAGCWCPVDYGRYLVVLSKQGHLAVFDPDMERKVWEGSIGGHYRQPPALAPGVLAAASNNAGLKLFNIHPFYSQT